MGYIVFGVLAVAVLVGLLWLFDLFRRACLITAGLFGLAVAGLLWILSQALKLTSRLLKASDATARSCGS